MTWVGDPGADDNAFPSGPTADKDIVNKGNIRTSDDLAAFWSSIMLGRRERIDKIIDSLRTSVISDLKIEQSKSENRLAMIQAQEFAGQAVFHNHNPAYVSLFRKVSA